MANEIYNRTWWGDAGKTAYSLLYGYGDADLLGGQLTIIQRTESEGGTVENSYCVAQKIHTDENI